MAKGKKSKGKHSVSAGLSMHARANRQITRLKMKIARWERNQSNPDKTQAGKSRSNWDTTGLKAHLALQEKISSRPAKRP